MNATALLLTLFCAAPEGEAPKAPPPLRHLPVAEVQPGHGLVLRVDAPDAWRVRRLTAHVRDLGEREFRQVALGRSAEGHFAAAIPVPEEQQAHLEYYLDADLDGSAQPVFATRELPHPVVVRVPEGQRVRAAMMGVHGHRRSRGSVFTEYVNYGSVGCDQPGAPCFSDWYYRAEIDYLHRMYDSFGPLRLDSIRIGMGHMRAQVPPDSAFTANPLSPTGADPLQRGLDYGFSEVEISLHRMFGMAGKILLGGNKAGFAAGGGARIRIGEPHRARVEVEGEMAAGVGGSASFRLAWDTVPAFPMSAAVQLTNVPSGPVGIRVLYRADWEVSPAFTLGAQVGYQARRAIGGGLSAGLATAVSW